MDNTKRLRRVRSFRQTKFTRHDSEGLLSFKVSSIRWEFISMTEQEEDLISRMYRLVGDRLIPQCSKIICNITFSSLLKFVGFNSRKSGRTKGK
ncbi:PREDICTED: MYB-like transcription factor ETC2 isoform X1 [Camelina sativa]|uniref:MYB-like transcription factor ETC2 isoform X1 n=1 Tax=Camelina sativa TaxID=90675 RepID=A0ABM1RQX2_CAMSA|nr:PREDICTED: MYB-like transcription factor ETC2 isoform X1 [Camelina sativa]